MSKETYTWILGAACVGRGSGSLTRGYTGGGTARAEGLRQVEKLSQQDEGEDHSELDAYKLPQDPVLVPLRMA